MYFFIADTHFGHENVIRLCNRPFADVHDMNECLIENWNKRVHAKDTVFILGDMFFRCENVTEILSRLKGKKKLILGNHDTWIKRVDCMRYLDSIDTMLETSDGQRSLTLCHYPMLSWKHAMRSYMVHGHIHNDRRADYWPLIQSRERVLNAGVDVNGFMPVTFDEMLQNNQRFKLEGSNHESQ